MYTIESEQKILVIIKNLHEIRNTLQSNLMSESLISMKMSKFLLIEDSKKAESNVQQAVESLRNLIEKIENAGETLGIEYIKRVGNYLRNALSDIELNSGRSKILNFLDSAINQITHIFISATSIYKGIRDSVATLASSLKTNKISIKDKDDKTILELLQEFEKNNRDFRVPKGKKPEELANKIKVAIKSKFVEPNAVADLFSDGGISRGISRFVTRMVSAAPAPPVVYIKFFNQRDKFADQLLSCKVEQIKNYIETLSSNNSEINDTSSELEDVIDDRREISPPGSPTTGPATPGNGGRASAGGGGRAPAGGAAPPGGGGQSPSAGAPSQKTLASLWPELTQGAKGPLSQPKAKDAFTNTAKNSINKFAGDLGDSIEVELSNVAKGKANKPRITKIKNAVIAHVKDTLKVESAKRGGTISSPQNGQSVISESRWAQLAGIKDEE